jgi:fructosamine-3-kinase
MSVWNHITDHIGQATGVKFSTLSPISVSGGCINQAYQLQDKNQNYFVKTNKSSLISMFEAEAAGLREIAKTEAIRVPKPICFGTSGNTSYLVLEQIDMSGIGDMELAGRQLAQMHRKIGGGFGWHMDNTIGSTHQPNNLSTDWVEFWREARLGYQLKLATQLGYAGRLRDSGEKLLELLPQLITHHPQPSLLHGDLWGGNISFTRDGAPVIFDPAVYYGDREADIAMTELFGGFSSAFYSAYNETWPLDSGYTGRKTLYNLYHVLNHLNIFGGGYASQAQGMIDRLLSELRA